MGRNLCVLAQKFAGYYTIPVHRVWIGSQRVDRLHQEGAVVPGEIAAGQDIGGDDDGVADGRDVELQH